MTTIALVVAAFLLAACGDDGNPIGAGGADGRVTVHLIDAPAGVAALWVTVTDVRLKQCGEDVVVGDADVVDGDADVADGDADGGWFDLSVAPQTVDLLQLTGGGFAVLNGEHGEPIPAGDYCEVRLVLSGDSTVEFDDGTEETLKVPSSSSSGYKVKGTFTIEPDVLTILVLDLDAERSLHRAGNSGKYILRPVVEIASVDYVDLDDLEPPPAPPADASAGVD